MTVTETAQAPSMLEELRELWHYRDLLVSMVRRDLKVRYKNSFLGFLWSLVNPLIIILALDIAWNGMNTAKVPNMTAYVLASYLPYMFFCMAIMDATSSVLSNLALVKKIYFPREILPLTSVISNFIHFIFALGMFFVFLGFVYAVHPGINPFQLTSLYLPLLLLINFLLVAGLGFFLSAWNTFFEDVKYIVSLATTVLLFISPIIWFGEVMDHSSHRRWVLLNLLNPLTSLCTGYRRVLLAPPSGLDAPGPHNTVITIAPFPIEWKYIAYSGVMSLIIFIWGYSVFNKKKWKFVERP